MPSCKVEERCAISISNRYTLLDTLDLEQKVIKEISPPSGNSVQQNKTVQLQDILIT